LLPSSSQRFAFGCRQRLRLHDSALLDLASAPIDAARNVKKDICQDESLERARRAVKRSNANARKEAFRPPLFVRCERYVVICDKLAGRHDGKARFFAAVLMNAAIHVAFCVARSRCNKKKPKMKSMVMERNT
jgi:hypothetical protein